MNIQDKINILSKYNEDCIVGGGVCETSKTMSKGGRLIIY